MEKATFGAGLAMGTPANRLPFWKRLLRHLPMSEGGTPARGARFPYVLCASRIAVTRRYRNEHETTVGSVPPGALGREWGADLLPPLSDRVSNQRIPSLGLENTTQVTCDQGITGQSACVLSYLGITTRITDVWALTLQGSPGAVKCLGSGPRSGFNSDSAAC